MIVLDPNDILQYWFNQFIILYSYRNLNHHYFVKQYQGQTAMNQGSCLLNQTDQWTMGRVMNLVKISSCIDGNNQCIVKDKVTSKNI
jgi:hypothetical protein